MGVPAGMTREEDPIRRTRMCGWVRIATNVSVEHEVQGPDPLPRYGGLVVCGAIHVCAVCAANIRYQRSLEIGHAARAHLEAGGSLVMLTLTVPHSRGMPLDELWSLVSEGWHACATGRYRKADRKRWGRVDYVRAVEVTHGGNGWHPHLHVLLFLDGTDDLEARAAEVEQSWWERWSTFVVGRGYRQPSREHGVDARAVSTSTIGDYLVKVQDGDMPEGSAAWGPSQEMARADLKRSGRGNTTPFGLVDRWMADKDVQALAAWREWEVSSKGRRVLTWSRGLKDRYDVHELDDQTAAERRQWEAEVLYLLCPDEWDVVRDAGADFALLEEAAMGGREAVEAYLRDLLGIDELSCDQCEHNHDGLRTRPCNDCGARLRAVSGRKPDAS